MNDAVPPLSVPLPRVLVPFMNVTVPVAADGVTVAVNVTGVPNGTLVPLVGAVIVVVVAAGGLAVLVNVTMACDSWTRTTSGVLSVFELNESTTRYCGASDGDWYGLPVGPLESSRNVFPEVLWR